MLDYVNLLSWLDFIILNKVTKINFFSYLCIPTDASQWLITLNSVSTLNGLLWNAVILRT